MPLETATYIHDLVSANPAHADATSLGDSHLRLIKAVLQNQFPNWTSAALASTNANIDAAVSAVVTGPLSIAAGLVSAPSLALKSDATTGFFSNGAGKVDLAISGVQLIEWSAGLIAIGTANLTIATGGIGLTNGGITVTAGNILISTGNLTLSNGTLAVPAGGLTVGGAVAPFVPTGGTMVWWTDVLPTGYLWANGAAVSRTGQAALFALLGTAFGAGDGSTTFNLPDLREVAPMGKSTMGGTTSPGRITNYVLTTLGGFVGACLHLLTTGEMPSHTHTATVTDNGHTHPIGQGGGDGYFSGSGHGFSGSGAGNTGSNTTGITVANANQGGGGSHDNVSPGAVCNWIIKT